MKVFHKQLAILLTLHLLTAEGIGLIGQRFGYGLQGTILNSPWRILTGPYGRDSWKILDAAWNYWVTGNKPKLIYSNLLIRDRIKFLYPPHTLFIPQFLSELKIEPVAFYSITTRFFLALTIFGAFWIALYSLNRFGYSTNTAWDKGMLFALVSILSLFFYPLVEAGNLGQIQLWINALFAFALLGFMQGYTTASGILIGIMASIKPQYGLFLVWGLFRGEKKFAISVLLTAGVISLAGIFKFGASSYFDYINALNFLAHHGEAFMANHSINGLLNRIFSISDPITYNNINWRARYYPPFNPTVYYGTLMASLVFLIAALHGRKAKTGYSGVIDFCLVALASTMASPIAWGHHYGILFLIFIALWPFFWLNNTTPVCKFASLAFIGLYLISGNLFYFSRIFAQTRLNFLQSYIFLAALGIFALLFSAREQVSDFNCITEPPALPGK